MTTEPTSVSGIEREYAYKTDSGQYLMFGIVLALLGPATAYMGQQAEPGVTYIRRVGYLTQAQVGVLGWVAGAAFLLAGVLLVARTFPKSWKPKRIAFTPHAFVYPDPATRQEAVLDYPQITHVIPLEEGGQRLVRFTTPSGHVRLYCSGMKSVPEFEEMLALLKERTAHGG